MFFFVYTEPEPYINYFDGAGLAWPWVGWQVVSKIKKITPHFMVVSQLKVYSISL